MAIRFLVSAVIIFVLCILEYFFPYRKRIMNRFQRWPGNLMLVLIDLLLMKILFSTGVVGIAKIMTDHKIGLSHLFELKGAGVNVLMFIVLDFMIYVQHYFSHRWSVLWKFHRVHHSDPDLDFTSALRFHPVEIILSFLWKSFLVTVLGIDAKTVMVFEIVLNGMALFNHANIFIPKKLEIGIRLFFVTPSMHLIHHSILKSESDKNFSFNFSIWDYVFGTYQSSFMGHETIGHKKFSKVEDQSIKNLLIQPFK